MGKPMIMGRRTFESIGRPLPGRTSIVLTRDPGFSAEGVLVASSLAEAISLAGNESERASVIGGASLFQEAMPRAKWIYLTIIEAEFEGDVYFPELSGTWKLVSEERYPPDERNPWPYRFLLLEQSVTPTPFNLDAALAA